MVKLRAVAARQRGQGFIYLTALFAIAIIGLAVSTVSVDWSYQAQREREAELLFIGSQFRDAIATYYQQSPGTAKRYPGRLEDLIFDSRYLTIKRHLRRIYVDPVNGSDKWGIVHAPDGGIMGVYSLSGTHPIKVAGFGMAEAEFVKANSYSDWRFVYVPPVVRDAAPVVTPTAK